MKKLLAVAPYPYRSADTRYRICQFIPELEKAGWEVTLRPFMDETLFGIYNKRGKFVKKAWHTVRRTASRWIDCLNAGRYDAVLLHKEAFPFGPPIMEQLIHQNQPRLLYDMDDAFWTHPPQLKQIGKRLRDPNRIQKMIGLSKHVLAGNPFLAAFARQYNPRVTVFPTVLDTNRYTLRDEIDDGVVTIGWVGRWSSESYLETLITAFRQLSEKHETIQFRFVGAEGIHFPELKNVELVPWKLESEIEDIAAFDIGIMPLPDDIYSEGKCGFKLLQYMALGIPAVASPVGVNANIIADGENGFLATTEQEWVEKLSNLIINTHARKEIGAAGRKTVEMKYSVAQWAPRLIEILDEL